MYVASYKPEQKSPALLLHGGGVTGWMWESLQGWLEVLNRVLIPDLPGHGRSTRNLASLTRSQWRR